MRATWARLNFKPSGVKMLVANESRETKIRLALFAIVLAMLAGYFEFYYMDVRSRASQLQNQALAGKLNFADYKSPKSAEMWQMKNELDVLEQKSFKDLVYLSRNWNNRVEGGEAQSVQYNSGDGWFNQKQRYDSWNDDRDNTPENEIADNAAAYEEWKTMHEGVSWFDTAACIDATSRIGDANALNLAEGTTWITFLSSSTNTDWRTNIYPSGKIRWADEDLYKNLLKARIELI